MFCRSQPNLHSPSAPGQYTTNGHHNTFNDLNSGPKMSTGRRLPATPNKPSTLYSAGAQPQQKAGGNLINFGGSEFKKPSTLSFR